MNSINWPASSIWVFIAQLGEHCSANAEATGSNPVEAPKNFFSGYFSQLLKLRFTAMVTYSFHLYSRSSHHFIQYNINMLSSRKVLRIIAVGARKRRPIGEIVGAHEHEGNAWEREIFLFPSLPLLGVSNGLCEH